MPKRKNISLFDIYQALRSIYVTGFRRTGYRDAAQTALSKIMGKGNLFKCRKGISLDWLFNHNIILNARCLTDSMQCEFFLVYLLFWLYQKSKYTPETHCIRQVIFIDDASRFFGTKNSFGNQSTSPLAHILAVLRSAGICVIFATQLPAQIDKSLLAFFRSMIVVGNITGYEHLNVIRSFLSLSDDQVKALTTFSRQECLCHIAGSQWKNPIHGWTIDVPDFTSEIPVSSEYQNQIEAWHKFDQIPVPEIQVDNVVEPEEAKGVPNNFANSRDRLIYNCIQNSFVKANIHAKAMRSIREYDTAKLSAVQEGYLLASQCGKSIYLIPTKIGYEKFGFVNPYCRAVSVEHSFYVNLTAHFLKKDSSLKVKTETPIGTKGATIDLTPSDMTGNLGAIEIIFSTTNLLSNAAKLQGTAYQSILWLCRNAAIAAAVKIYFNKTTSLPPELIKKFKYTHFSKFEKERK